MGWKSYNLKADNHKISTESVKNEIGAKSENGENFNCPPLPLFFIFHGSGFSLDFRRG